jgi:hypothetical protein
MSPSRSDRAFEEASAKSAFNATWELLERRRLSPADVLRMLDLAHAARHHWAKVGTPRNVAVSDWQIARVYVKVGEPALALRYARSALSACERHRLSDLLPSAFEGVARAQLTGGDVRSAQVNLRKARALLERAVLDRDDREVYLGQIRETERRLRRRPSKVRSAGGPR